MCFRPAVPQKKENKCRKCNKINEPVAEICVSCGERLVPLPPPSPQPGGVAPHPAGEPPKPAPAEPKPPPTPPKPPEKK